MESYTHPNPFGHISFGDSFGDNDGFDPEIPRSNPDEDVSSTEDSENNTTDTDNKKGDRNERLCWQCKNWRWRMAVSLR